MRRGQKYTRKFKRIKKPEFLDEDFFWAFDQQVPIRKNLDDYGTWLHQLGGDPGKIFYKIEYRPDVPPEIVRQNQGSEEKGKLSKNHLDCLQEEFSIVTKAWEKGDSVEGIRRVYLNRGKNLYKKQIQPPITCSSNRLVQPTGVSPRPQNNSVPISAPPPSSSSPNICPNITLAKLIDLVIICANYDWKVDYRFSSFFIAGKNTPYHKRSKENCTKRLTVPDTVALILELGSRLLNLDSWDHQSRPTGRENVSENLEIPSVLLEDIFKRLNAQRCVRDPDTANMYKGLVAYITQNTLSEDLKKYLPKQSIQPNPNTPTVMVQ